jgi:hypothetical protein
MHFDGQLRNQLGWSAGAKRYQRFRQSEKSLANTLLVPDQPGTATFMCG